MKLVLGMVLARARLGSKDVASIRKSLASIPKRQGRPNINEDRHAKSARTKVESDAATAGSRGDGSIMDVTDVSEGLEESNHNLDEPTDGVSYKIVIENTF